MLLFSFRSEKWKETCLFFQPVPHYGAFQVCSFVWGQPRAMHRHSGAAGGLPRLTSTLQQNHQPLRQTPLPSVAWTLHALIRVAKEPYQDLTNRNSCCTAHTSVNNTLRSLNQGTAIMILDRMFCYPLIIGMQCDVQAHRASRLKLNAIRIRPSEVIEAIFLALKNLRSSSAFEAET